MARKTVKPSVKPSVEPCSPCGGTGEVSRTVRVGRKQRVVGQQAGICLNCLGSGEAPSD
ncbi:hypothetical protein [Streptomyces sp. NPDC047070]|uniref:hypothetical protein n=1 Tax=Streptomyces sp. NPDC047070 TaxID=3154923 RepID=UPI00345525C8